MQCFQLIFQMRIPHSKSVLKFRLLGWIFLSIFYSNGSMGTNKYFAVKFWPIFCFEEVLKGEQFSDSPKKDNLRWTKDMCPSLLHEQPSFQALFEDIEWRFPTRPRTLLAFVVKWNSYFISDYFGQIRPGPSLRLMIMRFLPSAHGGWRRRR